MTPKSLIKRLTTTTLAAAVALAGLAAAPARADSDDLVKVLVGVTGVYIVGNAISNSNKRGDRAYYHAAPRPYGHSSIHRRDAYGHNRAAQVRRDDHRFDRGRSRYAPNDHFRNDRFRNDRFRNDRFRDAPRGRHDDRHDLSRRDDRHDRARTRNH
jgi:hypothetical protein